MASLTLFALLNDNGTYSNLSISIESREKDVKEFSAIATLRLDADTNIDNTCAYFVWPPATMTFRELCTSIGTNEYIIYTLIKQALVRVNGIRE